jgi:hypothetical protein
MVRLSIQVGPMEKWEWAFLLLCRAPLRVPYDKRRKVLAYLSIIHERGNVVRIDHRRVLYYNNE